MAKYDYRASSPREIDDGSSKKTVWQNIGVAFKNKNAITIKLNALPIGDTICLFEPEDEEKQKRF